MAVYNPNDDPSLPPGSFEIPDSPGGGGYGQPPGAPGGSPFIPTFGFQGGSAQPFAGFQGFSGFSQMDPRRRLPQQQILGGGRSASPTTAYFRPPGQPGGPPIPPGYQAPNQPSAPFNPQTEQFGSIMDIINNLITHGVRGDMPGYGGAFSLNPNPAIMAGMRGQMIADAGAQQRQARLGLQSRGDADPSTYGFQSLMSDLQGQRNVAGGLNQANLALTQQNQQNYWNLLNSLLGSYTSQRNAETSRPGDPSPWGAFLGGLGNLGSAAIGKWG